jgi:hypothetical protein
MIENRAPIASMFLFQSYTIAIMIGRNSVNRDRCMTFDILTLGGGPEAAAYPDKHLERRDENRCWQCGDATSECSTWDGIR